MGDKLDIFRVCIAAIGVGAALWLVFSIAGRAGAGLSISDLIAGAVLALIVFGLGNWVHGQNANHVLIGNFSSSGEQTSKLADRLPAELASRVELLGALLSPDQTDQAPRNPLIQSITPVFKTEVFDKLPKQIPLITEDSTITAFGVGIPLGKFISRLSSPRTKNSLTGTITHIVKQAGGEKTQRFRIDALLKQRSGNITLIVDEPTETAAMESLAAQVYAATGSFPIPATEAGHLVQALAAFRAYEATGKADALSGETDHLDDLLETRLGWPTARLLAASTYIEMKANGIEPTDGRDAVTKAYEALNVPVAKQARQALELKTATSEPSQNSKELYQQALAELSLAQRLLNSNMENWRKNGSWGPTQITFRSMVEDGLRWRSETPMKNRLGVHKFGTRIGEAMYRFSLEQALFIASKKGLEFTFPDGRSRTPTYDEIDQELDKLATWPEIGLQVQRLQLNVDNLKLEGRVLELSNRKFPKEDSVAILSELHELRNARVALLSRVDLRRRETNEQWTSIAAAGLFDLNIRAALRGKNIDPDANTPQYNEADLTAILALARDTAPVGSRDWAKQHLAQIYAGQEKPRLSEVRDTLGLPKSGMSAGFKLLSFDTWKPTDRSCIRIALSNTSEFSVLVVLLKLASLADGTDSQNERTRLLSKADRLLNTGLYTPEKVSDLLKRFSENP